MSNQSGDPRIAHLTARKRPAVAFAIGLLASALLFLISAQAWNAWAARQLRLSEAAVNTSNMSRALAMQIIRPVLFPSAEGYVQ
jgi:Fe-S cluster biosynthesis and repair protein YggX